MLKTQIASPARNVLRGMKGNQVRTFIMRKYNPEFISHDANMLATLNGRVGVVGIAIGYGLDGPGINSRCGARFSAPVQTRPGAHPASHTMGIGSFPGVKRHGVDHPPPI